MEGPFSFMLYSRLTLVHNPCELLLEQFWTIFIRVFVPWSSLPEQIPRLISPNGTDNGKVYSTDPGAARLRGRRIAKRPYGGDSMCGIVGYLGRSDAVGVLLDGLRRLEYRGYDSAGVAVMEETTGVQIVRSQHRKLLGHQREAGRGRFFFLFGNGYRGHSKTGRAGASIGVEPS